MSAIGLGAQPERLCVFVSSTIAECAKQRREALVAIQRLGFDSFVFEKEGARTYGPRELYLGRLRQSQLAIAIYRADYGWVDEANGQTLSGLEDEYREIRRLNVDLLVYIDKTAKPDPKLKLILDEIQARQTYSMFDPEEDLTDIIHRDIVTLLTQTYHLRRAAPDRRAIAPQATLDAIFKATPYRIRRAGFDAALRSLSALHRAVWVTGAAGAGKTVALAQYAADQGLPYVNARGLDPSMILTKAAEAIVPGLHRTDRATSFADAQQAFISAWTGATKWPLVIDDPEDAGVLWSAVSRALSENGAGSVVLGSRVSPAAFPGSQLMVEGFTPEELSQLDTIADTEARRHIAGLAQVSLPLPLTVRTTLRPLTDDSGRQVDLKDRYLALKGRRKDIVAFLALGRGPLSLDDLARLCKAEADLGDLSDDVDELGDLIVEDASGYSLLHDNWAAELRDLVALRPQFSRSIAQRLIALFDDTGRGWRAFQAARDIDDETAAVQAERSIREIFYSGSIRHHTEASAFLVEHYRNSGDRPALIFSLVAFAQAASRDRNVDDVSALYREARAVADAIGDEEWIRFVSEATAGYALQTGLTPETLAEIQRLRRSYEDDDDGHSVARLLNEEGVALQAVNRNEEAEPCFRRALELFAEHQDEYGRELAARNLAGLLLARSDTAAEGEELLVSLKSARGDVRERAWMCNILNRRYRNEKRYEEAEKVALEAIAIGEQLGDRHLVAINQTALGNARHDDDRHEEALPAFQAAADEARAISRSEVEGRALRLSAACHNALAELSEGDAAYAHARDAATKAREAIAIFEGSIGSHDLSSAHDELATALITLGEREAGWIARARGIALIWSKDRPYDYDKQLRQLGHHLPDLPVDVAARATLIGLRDGVDDAETALEMWVSALAVTLGEASPEVAASLVSGLLQSLIQATTVENLPLALDRCLRRLSDRKAKAKPGNRALLLLNLLAFTARGGFRQADMLAYATLCLEGEEGILFRQIPTFGLQLVIELGNTADYLFTITAADESHEASFVALALGAFFAGCGDRICRLFLRPHATGPAAFDLMTSGLEGISDHLLASALPFLRHRPVAFLGFSEIEGLPPRITAFCRADIPQCLTPGDGHAGPYEIMLIDCLAALISYSYGVDIQVPEMLDAMKELLRHMLC